MELSWWRWKREMRIRKTMVAVEKREDIVTSLV